MSILVTSDRYSRHLKRKYIPVVTLGSIQRSTHEATSGNKRGILPSLLIFPLITLAFETCAPPTPVRKVSNTRTTHIWKTRGPLMVMTNARPLRSESNWCLDELSRVFQRRIPAPPRVSPTQQAVLVSRQSHGGEAEADIVVFTVRHELTGARLLLFYPLTGKYLAYFLPFGISTVRLKVWRAPLCA